MCRRSLLKKIEEAGIKIKTTRTEIIETLHSRRYIIEKRIVVTDLRIDAIEVLQKYCLGVISFKLTQEVEEKMEQIQNNNEKKENVLVETGDRLKPRLEGVKEKETTIGQALSDAIKRARMQDRIIGKCPWMLCFNPNCPSKEQSL